MVELLLKLRYYNPVIQELPLVLRYDRKQGRSKLKLTKTLLQYLKLTLRYLNSPAILR
jgi:dolichol-phosphate mannosyltransferase